MTTEQTLTAMEEIITKLPPNRLIEVGASMAILSAGASNDLDPGQKADIAKVWLRLYHYSTVTDVLRIIVEKTIEEKLDMDGLKQLIGAIGTDAFEERNRLTKRAMLLSETLLSKKDHAKK